MILSSLALLLAAQAEAPATRPGACAYALVAADRTGRRARLIELDPLYCDVICRRFIAAGGTAVIGA